MEVNSIRTVGIIGAGTMGLGIAQLCAMAGLKTLLFDIDEAMITKAIGIITKNLDKGIEKGKVTAEQKATALNNIESVTDLNAVKVDLVVEAIVERLEVKQKVFAQLEQVNGASTILATNTSSIPITQIAAGMTRPENVVGMHFFNPAHIMKLVEVISGVATAPEVAEVVKAFALKLGKVPVMAADSPGFIVNRVARHFYLEGLKVLEEGVSNIEDIDKLMQSSGFKMGPFQLMDLIGVDTNFSVTTSMFNAFHQEAKFRPNRIQQQKVEAGHHGRKSGQGFYKY